jgi:hypothetical protein
MRRADPASTNAFSTEATVHLRSAALGFCLLMLAAAPLHAAVIQTFTDQASFTAAVSIPPGNTVSIGAGGAAPNITVNGAAPSASAGPVTVTASPGNLFGDGTVISTDQDRAILVLTFDSPVLAIGFTPSITDANFGPLSGVLQVVLVGSGTETLPTTSPGFIGYESDTGISSVQILVLSFDTNVSDVAFATLGQSTLVGERASPIPAPGSGSLLIPFLALILVLLRQKLVSS